MSWLSDIFDPERVHRDREYENRLQREREDTAYQRMAKDKEAAGLHPLASIQGATSTQGQTVGQNTDAISKALNFIMLRKAVSESEIAEANANIAKQDQKILKDRGWHSKEVPVITKIESGATRGAEKIKNKKGKIEKIKTKIKTFDIRKAWNKIVPKYSQKEIKRLGKIK